MDDPTLFDFGNPLELRVETIASHIESEARTDELDASEGVGIGSSSEDIAAELALSVKTVSRHLSNIFVKIGVSSRSGATAFAFQQHLVDDA